MSDANRVNVVYAPEVAAGKLPPSATDWTTMRLTAEDLTGSTLTTESVEIRADRIPGNLVKVGAETVGSASIELSHGTYDDLILAALCGTDWTATGRSSINQPAANATMDVNGVLSDAAVDWAAAGFEVGMTVVVAGFADTNNGSYIIGKIANTNDLHLVRKEATTTEGPLAVTVDWTAPPNEEEAKVGVTERTFSIEKQYTDVGTYLMMLGCMVGEMTLSYQYQQILTGSFAWRGLDADPTFATQVPVGATTNPASTDDPLNASSDVAALVIDNEVSKDIIVQQLDITLDNGLRDVVGVGWDYPLDTNKGRSLVEGTINMYMSASAWQVYRDGLNLKGVYLSVRTVDSAGKSLEIILPNAVITGPAPPATGIDSDVMYQGQVRAQYDATHGSHIVIRRSAP